eukprot:2452087-Amphidinium_carterae.1
MLVQWYYATLVTTCTTCKKNIGNQFDPQQYNLRKTSTRKPLQHLQQTNNPNHNIELRMGKATYQSKLDVNDCKVHNGLCATCHRSCSSGGLLCKTSPTLQLHSNKNGYLSNSKDKEPKWQQQKGFRYGKPATVTETPNTVLLFTSHSR